MNCKHCNGTGVEPTADGIPCSQCKGTPSWVRSSMVGSSSSTTVGDVAGAAMDGVSDFLFWDAIGDIASSAVSGLGTAAECVGDVAGAVAECAGDIIGSAFD